MARTDLAATAKRLYERFLAPLVLGGELTPGPAVGARDALLLDGGTAAVDPDVRSQVDVARVRVARRLVGVDTVSGPSGADWALGAALHDMVHALHPDLDGVLHRSAPDRLLDFAEQVIARVPGASSLDDALSRHTFFARTFEVQRTDTRVSWWTGSKMFLGAAPPPRLVSWPELRRVHTDLTIVTLAKLPNAQKAARRERFTRLLGLWLEKVALTDLATCDRTVSAFQWSGATLGLFATPGGRVLGLRALALGNASLVDAALGRATALHVKASAWSDVRRIADVLAERAVAAASSDVTGRGEASDRDVSDDAHYARALGATAALERLDTLAGSAAVARQVTARLMPLAESFRGRQFAEMLKNGDAPQGHGLARGP